MRKTHAITTLALLIAGSAAIGQNYPDRGPVPAPPPPPGYPNYPNNQIPAPPPPVPQSSDGWSRERGGDMHSSQSPDGTREQEGRMIVKACGEAAVSKASRFGNARLGKIDRVEIMSGGMIVRGQIAVARPSGGYYQRPIIREGSFVCEARPGQIQVRLQGFGRRYSW